MKHFILLKLILLSSTASFAVMSGRPADATLSAATVTFNIKNGSRNCTGVVVHPHLILTAGHCTQEADQNASMEFTNDVSGGHKHSVRVKWKTAPGYKDSDTKEPGDIQKDFAYIITSADLVKELNLDPGQIPKVAGSDQEMKAALAAANNQAVGYGFGIYDSRGHAGLKKEVQVTVSLFEDLHVLKATSLESGVGVCPGDSGGGIFVRAENGRPLLLGNLSGIVANKGCGTAESYGAYSYVQNQVCWAQKSSGIDLGVACAN